MTVEIIPTGDYPFIDVFTETCQDPSTMRFCLKNSEYSWIGMVDDGVVCVWGLIPPTLLSNMAYLWLYTTPLVEEHKFMFVRHSQVFVEQMLKKYPLIVGHATTDNANAIRWIKWLGGVFSDPCGDQVPFKIRRIGS